MSDGDLWLPDDFTIEDDFDDEDNDYWDDPFDESFPIT